ncbi:MAG: hypothetical protein KBS59_00285 [Clostridiales bacterium]|nr:hypothetical protein [Clostridiales bacterium]
MIYKDCIHYEACKDIYYPMSTYDEEAKAFDESNSCDGCQFYSDASRFIELPCKVGDTVYVIFDKKVYEGKVVQTRTFTSNQETVYAGNALIDVYDLFYHDGRTYKVNVSFRISPRGSDHDAFLTREEAEKALAERRKS